MATLAGRRLLARVKAAGGAQSAPSRGNTTSGDDPEVALARQRYLQQSALHALLLRVSASELGTVATAEKHAAAAAPDPGHLLLSDGASYLLGMAPSKGSVNSASSETRSASVEGSSAASPREDGLCTNLFGGDDDCNGDGDDGTATLPSPDSLKLLEELAEAQTSKALQRCLAFLVRPGDKGDASEKAPSAMLPSSMLDARIQSMREFTLSHNADAELLRRRSVCIRADLLKKMAGQRGSLAHLVRRHKLERQAPRDTLTVDWLRQFFETFELKLKLERAVSVNRHYNRGTVPNLISRRNALESELALLAGKLRDTEQELSAYSVSGDKFRDVAERFKLLREKIAVVRDYLRRAEEGMQADLIED